MFGRPSPLISLVTLVLASSPYIGRAQDWTSIAKGIEYKAFAKKGTEVHAVRVDLCAPGVRVRATAPGEGPRTTSSFGQLVGAEVAVNGDWPSRDGEPPLPASFPRGLSIGDGKWFEGTVDRTYYGVTAFGANTVMASYDSADTGGPQFWMQDVVSGQPAVVWEGNLVPGVDVNDCAAHRARTAVGFNKEQTVFLLAVAEERSGTGDLTCNEMGEVMLSLGAHRAMQQDAGGSATMWRRGVGVLNKAAADQRSVVNHWAVISSGSGPPRSCVARNYPNLQNGGKRLVKSSARTGWKFEDGDIGFLGGLEDYRTLDELPTAPRWVQHSDSTLYLVEGDVKRKVDTFDQIAAWRILGADFETGKRDAELATLRDGRPLTESPMLFVDASLNLWLLDFAPLPTGEAPGGSDAGTAPNDAGIAPDGDGGHAGRDGGRSDAGQTPTASDAGDGKYASGGGIEGGCQIRDSGPNGCALLVVFLVLRTRRRYRREVVT